MRFLHCKSAECSASFRDNKARHLACASVSVGDDHGYGPFNRTTHFFPIW